MTLQLSYVGAATTLAERNLHMAANASLQELGFVLGPGEHELGFCDSCHVSNNWVLCLGQVGTIWALCWAQVRQELGFCVSCQVSKN